MVQICLAWGCNETYSKYSPYTFYPLPKARGRRMLWLAQLKRHPNEIRSTHVVCSKHFTKKDLYLDSWGRKLLKPCAYPSVNLNTRKPQSARSIRSGTSTHSSRSLRPNSYMFSPPYERSVYPSPFRRKIKSASSIRSKTVDVIDLKPKSVTRMRGGGSEVVCNKGKRKEIKSILKNGAKRTCVNFKVENMDPNSRFYLDDLINFMVQVKKNLENLDAQVNKYTCIINEAAEFISTNYGNRPKIKK